MARIPLDIERRGVLGRLAGSYSRKRYGKVVEPVAAAAHHRGVLLAYGGFETAVERTWTKLDPTLQILAVLGTAGQIGCSWCQDFGHWEARNRGVDAAKLRELPRWRDSDAFSDLERQVLGYAEAMTATPPTVTDETVRDLRQRLGDARLVELTALVALENYRSRFNDALGLQGQGFKESCDLRG